MSNLLSLEELYQDASLAQAAKNPKSRRLADPSVKNALDAAAKQMRELYTLPENWERRSGIALIDKFSNTLIGNFSEYIHKQFPTTRKLLREHQPIHIDRTEVVEGYLGPWVEERLRGEGSWTEVKAAVVDLTFPEMMVGAPQVEVNVTLYLGGLKRVDLAKDTQFASESGQTLLFLPAGTNVLEQMSADSKAAVRKATTA